MPQFWAMGATAVWLLCPFDIWPPFLEHLLTFWPSKIF